MVCQETEINDNRLNQFNKIIQLDLGIIEINEKYGNDELLKEIDQLGTMPHGSLDEVVDLNAIHMWLSYYTNLMEKRMAYLVTKLLSQGIELEKIGEVAYEMGKRNTVEFRSAIDAYNSFDHSILDGMPCEQVKEVIEQDEHQVVWERTFDIHTPAWQSVGGNGENYNYFLDQYILGMLSLSQMNYSNIKHKIFKIEKK